MFSRKYSMVLFAVLIVGFGFINTWGLGDSLLHFDQWDPNVTEPPGCATCHNSGVAIVDSNAVLKITSPDGNSVTSSEEFEVILEELTGFKASSSFYWGVDKDDTDNGMFLTQTVSEQATTDSSGSFSVGDTAGDLKITLKAPQSPGIYNITAYAVERGDGLAEAGSFVKGELSITVTSATKILDGVTYTVNESLVAPTVDGSANDTSWSNATYPLFHIDAGKKIEIQMLHSSSTMYVKVVLSGDSDGNATVALRMVSTYPTYSKDWKILEVNSSGRDFFMDGYGSPISIDTSTNGTASAAANQTGSLIFEFGFPLMSDNLGQDINLGTGALIRVVVADSSSEILSDSLDIQTGDIVIAIQEKKGLLSIPYNENHAGTPEGAINEGEYAANFTDDDYTHMTIYWDHDGEYIYIGLLAAVSGYLSIGWSNLSITDGPDMANMDIIIGHATHSAAYVEDHYGTNAVDHARDHDQDRIVKFGGLDNGLTTILEFQIELNSLDHDDVPLIPGSRYYFVLAVANEDNMIQYHSAVSREDLVVTLESYTPPTQTSSTGVNVPNLVDPTISLATIATGALLIGSVLIIYIVPNKKKQ